VVSCGGLPGPQPVRPIQTSDRSFSPTLSEPVCRLSRHGLQSRQPAMRRRWAEDGRYIRWWARCPLWAKVAGAALVATVVGGLALLAWGALRSDSKDRQDEEKIINAVLDEIAREPRNRADRSTASADLMTERQASDEIRRFLALDGGQVMSGSVTAAERLVWLVKVRGQFVGLIGIGSPRSETRQGEVCGSCCATAR